MSTKENKPLDCLNLMVLDWPVLQHDNLLMLTAVLLLGIASKIEPPTHSHEILISSTLLTIEKRSLPAQDYKGPVLFLLVF